MDHMKICLGFMGRELCREADKKLSVTASASRNSGEKEKQILPLVNVRGSRLVWMEGQGEEDGPRKQKWILETCVPGKISDKNHRQGSSWVSVKFSRNPGIVK